MTEKNEYDINSTSKITQEQEIPVTKINNN